MNINIKKFLLLFFAFATVISAQASRVIRTDNLIFPSETVISETENSTREVITRIKRKSSSSLKIKNTHFSNDRKKRRLNKKINGEAKIKNRISRVGRVSNFSPQNKYLVIKENVSKKFKQNKLVKTISPWQATSVKNNGNINFGSASGEWFQYFFDDFEDGYPALWNLYGTPTWGTNSLTASTGNQSVWCAGYDYSPNGNYFDNMDAWIIQGPFNLSASDDALLYFDFLVKSQPNVDKLFVGISTDGENFSGNQFSGDSGGWVTNSYIDAKDYAYSNSVYIGVVFSSDATISNYDGAFVDNIELIGYQLVSNTSPDLAVQNVHISDSFDGIFNFDIKNNSAQNQPQNSYYISVFVDDEFDSKETNQYELASGDTVTWDWQLAYYYLPGEHNVKILVEEDGGDVNTNDNTAAFTIVVTNKSSIDLGVSNPVVVSPVAGWLDFDVDNYGPAIAISNSYVISVFVDNEFDSLERNIQPLYPNQFTTWQWVTAYIYPSGTHSVEVKINSDISDSNPNNDSITFDMVVPAAGTVATDLKLSGIKITDEKNAVFKFNILNKGPKKCETGDYTIRVYVDDLLDSETSNSKNLAKGVTAIWTWQLQYIYPAGLHKIKIDVRPSGGDLKPENNTLLFQMVEFGANLQVYDIPVFTSVVNHAFSASLSATNGAPPYSWEIATGSLPNGINLNGYGSLSGVPTTPGSYSLKLKCYDASGASSLADLSIIVLENEPVAPIIIDTILPVTFQDTYFQLPLNAVGGTTPYSWAFNGGAPAGINISSTGSLYGSVAAPGKYYVPVKVTDNSAVADVANLSLQVLTAAQTINYQIKKIKIVIPWEEHTAGNNDCDSIKFNAEFAVPSQLVIGNYTRLTVFIGDYPISFIKPVKSKLTKKSVFKTDKENFAKGKATIKKAKDKIKLSLSMKNIDLATALEKYGVSENAGAIVTFPIRISVSDCDSGARESAFKYTKSKSGKGKINN